MNTTVAHDDAFERNARAYAALIEQLHERMRWALDGGGQSLRERHLARGKLLVRDRIDLLLDPGSPFLELSPLACWGMYDNQVPAAGIVTGIGRVCGVNCMVIANDATVKGGSFFAETVRKHVRAQEIAWENRLPCLYLVDCGGAYLPEQDRVFPDYGHFGTSFYHQCRMSADGLPQLSAVFGGCTAGGAYIPALSDESVMVAGTGRIHLGGPPIVKAAIAEVVDGETLGGAAMHARVSGVTDHLAMSETEALATLRRLVAGLNWPACGSARRREARPPRLDPAELPGIVGTDLRRPYDVREVVWRLVDDSEFQEFKAEYGTTLVCGTAHLHGYPVGILANNGVLFSDASIKGAHFIELCNQRRIPLLFLQNITGFMVGTEAERGGIAKHSAKLVYAMATARVPRFTVLIGGSYGAGNYGMCGRGFAPRFLFAWPGSRVATMSPEVASTVLTELRRASLKGEADEAELQALAARTRAQFETQSDPYYATARLWDDGIIEPAQTRDVLGICLELADASTPRFEGQPPCTGCEGIKIDTLLVANRGEIACRIFRTCRRLGIRTVAVYSEADAGARHVREADLAMPIGAAPARASYLDVEAIVRAARASGAQAIHPGYGFLSERLDLLDACHDAGLLFIGPHRQAMAAMGDKIAAKRIAREAGVACVPGYDGEDQDDARLAEEAQRIGFPLLIKASAGGGGKGMRRVDRAEDFAAQLALARAEARAAFGDEHVLLERYLCRPRHLEVQLLGDRHGHLVHLHERECSIQRHYQKLVEEAPAPHLTDAMRERLHAAALSLGRAIGYDSAGTVEFVLDADSAEEPYFLEMNTRLQVEHPVTELVTGIDLVEAQIRSACGEPLPWRQQDIRCTGWAIEVRLNAESPAHGFRASFGPLTACVEPALPGVRVDSGIDARSEVSPHYDPLLGKLVAHGATRTVARERLRRAVVDWRIEGVATTQPLLADVLAHPAFDAPLCTGFLDTVFPGGWRPPTHARPERAATVAAAAWYFAQTRYAGSTPMGCLAGWRLTAPAGRCGRLSLRLAEAESGHEARVELALDGPTRAWSCDDEAHPVRWLATEDGGTADTLVLAQAGVRWLARVDGHAVSLWSQGLWQCWTARPEVDVPPATAHGHGHADDAVVAELPGLLARLLVAPGQAVAAGEPVAVLEAMKLMHTLCAPRDGTVVRVGVREGDTVARGTVLVELAPPSAP